MKQLISFQQRYKIENLDDGIRITINSRKNLAVIIFIVLWWFLWMYMFGGLLFVWQMLFLVATKTTDPNYYLYFVLFIISIFLLALLFLVIFSIYKSFWEVFGTEVIEVNKEKLIVVRQILVWRRVKKFPAADTNNLIVHNTAQNLSWHLLRKQYTYAFELGREEKAYCFGYLLKEDQTKEILSAIQNYLLPTNN